MNDINNKSDNGTAREAHLSQEPHDGKRSISTANWVLIGFLLISGYFLIMEHRAHVIAFLPWLLLLACPLLHLFMHGKHGGGRQD